MRKLAIVVVSLFVIQVVSAAVMSVAARQRYPWNGLVDITVTIQGTAEDVAEYDCVFAATNSATKAAILIEHITQNGGDVASNGVVTRKFIWDAKTDVGAVKVDDVVLTVDAFVGVQLWENGPYWARCNVGATKPEECGYYFWWGDTVGYKRNSANNGWVSVKDGSSFSFSLDNCPTSDKNNSQLQSAGYIDATGNLVAAHDAATAHLGAPWRMPTDAEFSALINNCDTEWTSRNGISGRLIKGRGAYASKSIFFPAAGYGRFSILDYLGSNGDYWSSTPTSDYSDLAWGLYFGSGDFGRGYSGRRRFGQSVRPVRGFANANGGVAVSDSAVTTHLSLDCLAGAKVADSSHPLVYDAAWYADGATAKIMANGQEIVSGVAGSYAWTPATDGVYLLTLKVYNSAGNVVGEETALFLSREDLSELVIPEGTTEIGAYAFAGGAFASVTIPSSVTSIGEDAFYRCSGLKSFSVDASNSSYSSRNGLLCSKDGSTLIAGVNGVVTVPDCVTSIGWGAFAGCSGLTSVTIPSSVTSIGEDAFYNCSKLVSVSIPSSVTSIGEWAFCGCEGLTSVTIPLSVTSIGMNAFVGCENLRTIRAGEGTDIATLNSMLSSSMGSYYYGEMPVVVSALPDGGWGSDVEVESESSIVFHPMSTWNPDCAYEIDADGEAIVTFDFTVRATLAGGSSRGYCKGEFAFYLDRQQIDPKNESEWYYANLDNWSARDYSMSSKVAAFLTPGKHILTWKVLYAYSSGCDVRLAVENLKIEPSGRKDSLLDWARMIYDFHVWRPGNLAYLRDDIYGKRIAENPADYEARLYRAATKLLLLGENAEIREFIKDCGYTIEDYTMKFTGKNVPLDKMPLANETIDRLSPEVLAAIDSALEDIAAIPENWNGSIMMNPKDFEFLDEPVAIDMAEITLLRAVLEGLRSNILLVRGYDFEMDYADARDAFVNSKDTDELLAAVPKAGRIRNANELLAAKEWLRKSLLHIRRADQIIVWRTNLDKHFLVYDRVDGDKLARARLYLEQLIGSLDHPETIDLPYFADQFGYADATLPCGMFRQLYLGALFAGRVTRDLVPTVQLRPIVLAMNSVQDVTLGGLLPDLSFEEFATLYPFSQTWSLALYDAYRPQSQLARQQTLTVSDVAFCDGTLEYSADLTRQKDAVASCVVDGLTIVTDIANSKESGSVASHAIPVNAGSCYDLAFTANNAMNRRIQVFDILGIPEFEPSGAGDYTETVGGVEWRFTIADDVVTITGVPADLSGEVVVPSKLGGRAVVAIGEEAFRGRMITALVVPETITAVGDLAFWKCNMLSSIRFLGEAPAVGFGSFTGTASTAVFNEGTNVPLSEGKWNGLAVSYEAKEGDKTEESLRVHASLPDGYEFNGFATLELFAADGATIFFTMNGDEPSEKSLVYTSPISVSGTTRIKYYAVDSSSGSFGPKGTVLLRLVSPSSEILDNSVCAMTVNGISWDYQEQPGGVKLTANHGFGSGVPLSGAVVIPAALDWQPVTSVGASLFAGADAITSVSIPSSVRAIERNAFSGCTHLESVSLPEGLETIGDNAFERCTSLKSIAIPASVTNIGYFAFRDCLRLEEVKLLGEPPRQDLGVYMGVPAFTTISGRLGSAMAIVYASVTNATEDITVPEGWLDELAVAHDKPAGSESYQAAFFERFGTDLKAALTKPTGKHDLKGNPLYVWQDYVAGTDPLKEEDAFTATITMEGGIPVVHWSPELTPAAAAKRKYTTYGATALGGGWTDISDLSDADRHAQGYQFFWVSVELKK